MRNYSIVSLPLNDYLFHLYFADGTIFSIRLVPAATLMAALSELKLFYFYFPYKFNFETCNFRKGYSEVNEPSSFAQFISGRKFKSVQQKIRKLFIRISVRKDFFFFYATKCRPLMLDFCLASLVSTGKRTERVAACFKRLQILNELYSDFFFLSFSLLEDFFCIIYIIICSIFV